MRLSKHDRAIKKIPVAPLTAGISSFVPFCLLSPRKNEKSRGGGSTGLPEGVMKGG
jgi:hypothetical protein